MFLAVVLLISLSSAFWPFNAQVINPIPVNVPLPNNANCIDSDSGIFSEVKGNVSKKTAMCRFSMFNKRCFAIYSDYCINSSTLLENYCNKGTRKFAKIGCENGCEKGVCKLQSKNLSNYCENFIPVSSGSSSGEVSINPSIAEPNENISIFYPSSYLYDKSIYITLTDHSGNELKRIYLDSISSRPSSGTNEAETSLISPENNGEYDINICGNKVGKIIVKNNICKALFDSTNNYKNKDRINMVFIGVKNYRTIDKLKEIAKELVSIDGNSKSVPYLDTGGGSFFEKSLDWGLLAIEPMKSSKDKFNFWYLDTLIENSDQMIYPKLSSFNGEYCGLNHVYFAILSNEVGSEYPYSQTNNFWGSKNLNKDNIIFYPSVSYINIREDGQINTRQQFVHETSHSVFGLPDEYYGSFSGTNQGTYPTCAPNIETANTWWASLIGQVDPFYYEYKKAMNDNGLTPIDENNLKIDYVYGGCYFGEGDRNILRPTNTSIMGSSIGFIGAPPVFGSVNRRRAEQVLNLFSGS